MIIRDEISISAKPIEVVYDDVFYSIINKNEITIDLSVDRHDLYLEGFPTFVDFEPSNSTSNYQVAIEDEMSINVVNLTLLSDLDPKILSEIDNSTLAELDIKLDEDVSSKNKIS